MISKGSIPPANSRTEIVISVNDINVPTIHGTAASTSDELRMGAGEKSQGGAVHRDASP
jgi:hypothetical protein